MATDPNTRDPNAAVRQIAHLRNAEASLIKAGAEHALIAAAHLATCAALTALLGDHGAKLGLDAQTVALASEPKHK